MPIRLSCPSCNTAFTLPEMPADSRAHCPRCGDQFPIRTFTEIAASEDTSSRPATSERSQLSPKAHAQWSVQRAAFVAIGMGLIGLVAGVVVYYRSGIIQPKPQVETPPPTAAIPADQLVGLGYLSDDTNITFAVQPGPILAYAERMKKDPRELLIQAGIPAKVYDSFTSLGLTLQQIDHIAGGTSFGDIAFTLRLTLVLVLRGPFSDEDEFLHKLKARK